MPAWWARLMGIFLPLIRNPSPSGIAVVTSCRTSKPLAGSVRQNAASTDPLAICGSSCDFWSGDPCCTGGRLPMVECSLMEYTASMSKRPMGSRATTYSATE